MAHNLTITVSEDLWNRIQRWRDRLPISRLCQEVLAREVNRLENLPREVSDMEQLIERLRAEKGEFQAESYRAGVQDGISWAKAASYEDLLQWSEIASLRGIVLDNWMLPQEALEDLEPPVDQPRYQRGWLDAVLKVWNVVKSKI